MSVSLTPRTGLLLAVLSTSGIACQAIAGLGDFSDAAPSSGGGGAGGAGGAMVGGVGGQGGDGGDGGTGEVWLSNYAYRMKLTLGTSLASEDLVDFPSPVAIGSSSNLKDHAKPDGGDIAFTADDGATLLSYEIETYDQGALMAWVRLPTISARQDSVIYLYFGGLESSNNVPSDTWPPDIWSGVWHFNNEPNAAPMLEALFDSTTYGANAEIASGATPPTKVPSPLGAAYVFNGTTDPIQFPASRMPQLDVGPATAGFSCWISSTGATGRPLQKASATQGYLLSRDAKGWNAELRTPVAGAESIVSLNDPFALGDEWAHFGAFVGIGSAGVPKLAGYTNGSIRNTVVLSSEFLLDDVPAPAEPLVLSPNSAPFEGMIDEFRLYAVVPSAEWISLEVASVTTPGYLTVGPLESAPDHQSP